LLTREVSKRRLRHWGYHVSSHGKRRIAPKASNSDSPKSSAEPKREFSQDLNGRSIPRSNPVRYSETGMRHRGSSSISLHAEAGGDKMDFCYIDGGSRLPYTKLALQHMNPGGLIAVDDCAGDWRGAKMLRRMANLYLPTHRGLVLITV